MKDFEQFCKEDSSFKELSGKWDAQRANANTLLHTAEQSSKKEDIESFRAANDELNATTALLDGKRKMLQHDYAEKTAEQEAAERGMQAVNGLRSGGEKTQSNKSLLELMESNEKIKALPRVQHYGEEIIQWNSPEARKTIALQFDAREFDPRNALRSTPGMRAAGEITTTAAPSPYQIMDLTVPYGLYPSTLLDVLPTFRMTNKSVTYRREDSLTRNEAATGETLSPTASTFQINLVTDTAHAIKGKFRVTEEELLSRTDALPFITFESERDLRRTGANQILQGDNTGENLNGIYNQATGSFTKGTSTPLNDNNGSPIQDIDAIGYAIQDCKVNGACIPSLGILHPNQFMPIRLMKNAIGDYIYGPPNQPITNFYVLGVRFLEEIEAIDGTGLVGDFSTYYALGIFQGITVEIGMSASDFENWERTVRFWFYGVNQVRRPRAFEKIANLTSAI